jgi:hypothetical protein
MYDTGCIITLNNKIRYKKKKCPSQFLGRGFLTFRVEGFGRSIIVVRSEKDGLLITNC